MIWRMIGRVAYVVLFPAIVLYARLSAPRSRVLILYKSDILLVKNWLGAGNWALPGGGIHASEQPAAAAVREVQEELGISIVQDQLIDLGLLTVHEGFGFRTRFHLCVVRLSEMPSLTLQRHEIMAADWHALPGLSDSATGYTQTVIRSVGVWKDHQNLL